MLLYYISYIIKPKLKRNRENKGGRERLAIPFKANPECMYII